MDQIFNESQLSNFNIAAVKIVPNKDEIKADKFMFGSALKYIFIGQKGKTGQGDINEGLIARYKIDNKSGLKRIEQYKSRFGNDIIIREKNGFREVFRKSSLLTAMGCFYNLNEDVTKYIPDDTENFVVEINEVLNNLLFKDFIGDGKIKSKDLKVINYQNARNIFCCIEDGLKKYGIDRSEIFMKEVKYCKIKDSEWECCDYLNFEDLPYPPELFYKDESFTHQKEKRIIICSDKFRLYSQFSMNNNLFLPGCFDRLHILIEIKEQDILETHNPEMEIGEGQLTNKISIPIKRLR